MSDPATRLFEFDKAPTSPGVPPYVITSVTLRSLINKFLQERKKKVSSPASKQKSEIKSESKSESKSQNSKLTKQAKESSREPTSV